MGRLKGILGAILAATMLSGSSAKQTADENKRRAGREGGKPYGHGAIYIPAKHTKQTYAAQNRAAKKRRNIKARSKKK